MMHVCGHWHMVHDIHLVADLVLLKLYNYFKLARACNPVQGLFKSQPKTAIIMIELKSGLHAPRVIHLQPDHD